MEAARIEPKDRNNVWQYEDYRREDDMRLTGNILLALVMSVFSFATQANPVDKIAVYAVEKSRGSVSVAEQSIYTKSFNVILENLSEKDISLFDYCIKGISPDGKEFIMSPVKYDILKNTLQAHKTVQGIFSLHGNNISVQKTALVKLSNDCISNQNDKLPFPLENGYID
ncbi:DUF4354 family protein [Escherichia coli]|uniref:DUF4354 family protein n=1 Tax=Escherichia coli TaxID=562 RepID=UPI0016B7A727|nr:DUF4354 family protein [Escherichia coli]EGH4617057.1 DUF4354 family protein [Escherichia coli]